MELTQEIFLIFTKIVVGMLSKISFKRWWPLAGVSWPILSWLWIFLYLISFKR